MPPQQSKGPLDFVDDALGFSAHDFRKCHENTLDVAARSRERNQRLGGGAGRAGVRDIAP
jgi:hypothetical protein